MVLGDHGTEDSLSNITEDHPVAVKLLSAVDAWNMVSGAGWRALIGER